MATAIKERPIIFSGAMVRAILDESKTQTRRVMKPQPPEGIALRGPELYEPTAIDKDGEEYPGEEIFGVYSEDGDWGCKYPFGMPGDRLWVRETFRVEGDICNQRAVYRADCVDRDKSTKWRPSIHMPRWASRLTLEITDVRVERVQDISEADAINEGCKPTDNVSAVEVYASLWDSINAKRGFGWGENPHVWVIEFKEVHG